MGVGMRRIQLERAPEVLARHAPTVLPPEHHPFVSKVVAALLLFAAYSVFALSHLDSGAPGVTVDSVAAGVFGALTAWFASYFWIGLFLRIANEPSRVLCCLTGASYWIYLVHVPLEITSVGLLAPLLWPAALNVPCVFTATSAVCLLSYALFVRGSFVSVVLSGRRYPRGVGVPMHTD